MRVEMGEWRGLVSGIVLAGGRARRLGLDKPYLVLGSDAGSQVTMIEAVVTRLSAVTNNVVVVGGRRPEIRSVDWTTDRLVGAGPLGGLEAGLAAVSGQMALTLGSDMPFVTVQLLKLLVERAVREYHPGRPLVVIPRSRRGLEPLCAVYSIAVRPMIVGLIHGSEARVRRVSDLLAVADVVYVEERELCTAGDIDVMFFNVNTANDLIKARRMWNEQAGV